MSHSITIRRAQTETATAAQHQGRFNRFISWLRVLCCTCPVCCIPPNHRLDHRARFIYYHHARFMYYGVWVAADAAFNLPL